LALLCFFPFHSHVAPDFTKRAVVDPAGVLREAHDVALRLAGVGDTLPEKVAEARKKADEARRLAQLNVKFRQWASPKTSFKSMEEEMMGVYERLHGVWAMDEPINAFVPGGMRSKNRNAEIAAALEDKQTKSTEEWIAAYAEESDLLIRLIGEDDRVKDQNERLGASLLCFAGRVPS
jgi:hypothetical protein